MRHADGHWVWVHDISTAVLDAQGNLDYFLGFLTDVSSRRDAEERLREAELTFRTLVEQNPAVFYVQGIDPADPTRSLTEYIGPGAEELTGVPIEQMTANPEVWRTMIHPDDQERVFAADAASNTDGSNAFSLEYRIIRKDGRVVWVLDEATLVRPEGRFPYWQGFQLDITARKEAEQRLQDAHEHLRLMVDVLPRRRREHGYRRHDHRMEPAGGDDVRLERRGDDRPIARRDDRPARAPRRPQRRAPPLA